MKKRRRPQNAFSQASRNLSVRCVITSFKPRAGTRFPVGPVPGYRTRRKAHALPIVRDEFRPAIPRRVARQHCRRVGPGIAPEPLTDPDLSLSTHPARATHRKLPPSVEISRFLLLPVDQIDPNAGDLPPSLHGHYSVSSVLRGSPSLTDASVLSASRGCHLRLFPYHRQPGSQVPYESPDEIHAA
jgi:hypothetical protein